MGLLKKDAMAWTRLRLQNFFYLIDNVISKNHTKSKRMLSIFKIDKTWQFSSYNFDKHKLVISLPKLESLGINIYIFHAYLRFKAIEECSYAKHRWNLWTKKAQYCKHKGPSIIVVWCAVAVIGIIRHKRRQFDGIPWRCHWSWPKLIRQCAYKNNQASTKNQTYEYKNTFFRSFIYPRRFC